MKRTTLLSFLFLICMFSCRKITTSSLSGKYIEYTPMSGEMQLEFVAGNIMIKTETGSVYRDSFYYTLGIGSISITPAWTNIYPASSFDFWVLYNNTIKIQNLNASIPEAPKTYMIFKKQ